MGSWLFARFIAAGISNKVLAMLAAVPPRHRPDFFELSRGDS
jgi:hypothetical protein